MWVECAHSPIFHLVGIDDVIPANAHQMKDVFERALSLQNIDKIIAIIDCVEFVPNLTANAAVFPIDAARLDRLQNRQKYQTIRDILAQIVDVVIVAVAVNDFERINPRNQRRVARGDFAQIII